MSGNDNFSSDLVDVSMLAKEQSDVMPLLQEATIEVLTKGHYCDEQPLTFVAWHVDTFFPLPNY